MKINIFHIDVIPLYLLGNKELFNGMCFSVTLHIVVLWLYYACCIRPGVTRCTIFMVHYLCRMCQSGLHAVLWSHIGIFMLIFAAEPHSTAGLLFLSVSPYNDFMTMYSMVLG